MSLVISDLAVSYGTVQVLAGIDLTVASGERFAIMGPSGSGKSTLLRTIAGLTAATSGSVSVDDVDMSDVPAHKRPVGLMFQDYALFPHMTVLENIGYGLRMSGVGVKEREDRSRELLDLVGLGAFAERRPATLSGGEQQRVALARTLARSPSVVLLDEPLGSLDISLRESLLAETRAILDAVNATSVYVTHDRTEAFAFCDRMAILHEGSLVRVGTPDEIWRDPRSEFVARAIGQTNIIPLHTIDPSRSGSAFVPLDAITVHPDGSLRGTAIRSRFDDGVYVVQVRTEEFTIEVRMPKEPRQDSEIRFGIDREAVTVVSTDEIGGRDDLPQVGVDV